MLNGRTVAAMAAGMVLAGVCASQASAQWGVVTKDATPGGRGAAMAIDPNSGTMVFDANAWRKAASDRMKQMLGATDEEWTVMEPMIDKVQKLTNDIRFSAMMGGMVFMGMGGPGAEPSDLAKAARELAKVLAAKDSSPGDIKDAVTKYRDAKAKAKAELEKAQKELKEILTARQEALLIQMGLLD